MLVQSGAKVMVYLDGFEYPVFYTNLLSVSDEEVDDEINLAWLIGCLNGNYGNRTFGLNKLWVMYSDFAYISKESNQYLPSAEICESYFKKKKLAWRNKKNFFILFFFIYSKIFCKWYYFKKTKSIKKQRNFK